MEDATNISTSPDSESHEEKGPSSGIKLNHPPEVIVGNMNELTLRKHIVDKCVTNYVKPVRTRKRQIRVNIPA